MDFIELKNKFENQISEFELLEFHDYRYSFGSGIAVYRIKGHFVKIIYDGKESKADLLISTKHENYSNPMYTEVFSGKPMDLIETDILKIYKKS